MIESKNNANSIINKFDYLIRIYVAFTSIFVGLLIIELLFLIFFFPFFVKSALFAFGLAIFFLTLFSFFLFRIYFKTIKLDKFDLLISEWMKDLTSNKENQVLEHNQLASQLTGLADKLIERERSIYHPPQPLKFCNYLLSQLSFWCHWEDLMIFREMLLKRAIKEYFKIIRIQPTHLEVHIHLANTYIQLSSLYRFFSQKLNKNQEFRFWLKKRGEALETNFRGAAEKAIEEMKILKELAPYEEDVDLQLASLYQDLQMIKEETRQYEIIIENNPQNGEALFQLGSLYFQQGMKAKGLQIYQQLKQQEVKNAEELLNFYDFST